MNDASTKVVDDCVQPHPCGRTGVTGPTKDGGWLKKAYERVFSYAWCVRKCVTFDILLCFTLTAGRMCYCV